MAGALGLGAAAFAVVFWLRTAGLLYGPWVPGAFVLLLALGPVSRHLSGRIAWTLSVLFGLLPLLWWIPVEWPPTLRSTVLLSAAAAVPAFCAVWRPGARGTGRGLWPQLRAMDAMPALAAVGGVFAYLHQLSASRVDDAMSLMLMAWDNASHFNIFHMQRIHGTVLPLAGRAGDGSRWAFADYPQGFHSVLVLVAELATRTSPTDWAADAVAYVNFSAQLDIAVVVLVVAAVCTLPALRRNPAIGAPVAVLVASGWLCGPGALASMHGFPNFFFTTGLVAAAVLLFHSMQRAFDPLPLVAAGACVAGVLQNWVLLIVFLVPSAVAVAVATPRGRWRASRGERACAVAVVAVVAAAGLGALGQLSGVPAEDLLSATGGVPVPDFGLLLSLLLVLTAVSVLLGGRTGTGHPSAVRTRWSLGAVFAGLAVALAMAAVQLATSGAVGYYTQKVSIALVLVALVGLGIGANGVLERRPELGPAPGPGRSPRVAAASVAVSLALSQAFGFIFPLKSMGLPPTSASAVEAARQLEAIDAGSAAGERLLAAVRASAGLHGPALYLTTHPADVDPILAQQWFNGLRADYSEHSWTLSLAMVPLSGGPENLPKVVADLKAQDPTVHIVVDPENQAVLDRILAALP
ncbi:hypothetical protein ACQCSX_08895 [Pseudarthrobacter sp. P1]|uniref:hypothetical protein n=1 Tax=Pseudarthrobacter sp. P1 TaxID=3418418 RepID=UPI003CE7AF0D